MLAISCRHPSPRQAPLRPALRSNCASHQQILLVLTLNVPPPLITLPCTSLQAETFEVVKANLYQSLGQLATVMDDAHLDFLFQRFESARSRPLPDTLRLFGLLQQLVLSDSRVSC